MFFVNTSIPCCDEIIKGLSSPGGIRLRIETARKSPPAVMDPLVSGSREDKNPVANTTSCISSGTCSAICPRLMLSAGRADSFDVDAIPGTSFSPPRSFNTGSLASRLVSLADSLSALGKSALSLSSRRSGLCSQPDHCETGFALSQQRPSSGELSGGSSA